MVCIGSLVHNGLASSNVSSLEISIGQICPMQNITIQQVEDLKRNLVF